MKKILSFILSLAMLATMCVSMGITAFAADGDYTVAGDAALTEVAWDPASNPMTEGNYTFDNKNYDFTITFKDIAAGSYSFKVTDGTWTNSWGNGDEFYSITLTNTCAVTIYFNSQTKAIAVDAEFLGHFVLDSVTAVGNGNGSWLNGVSWDAAAEENNMTETEPGVWQITYTNIAASDNYQVKFAVNHDWTYNWTSDGVFDGLTNPSNVVEKDGSTVILTIDLNNYDFTDKTGSVATSFKVIPPDEAITAVGGTKSADVKGTYVAGTASDTVYSVDVTWGSMEFTYTDGSKGTWNPDTHDYDNVTNGTWSETDNTVTVTNHSNTAIDATLSYASETSFSGITGKFTESSGTANDGILSLATAAGTTVADAPTAAASLKLEGELSSGAVASTKIGTVTVTINNQ